ncbi:MAG: peptidase S41 [Ignavibacteria bacterium]|jgi:tricorn protease|nr:peptidase S41 [Ignavibacteria bacterium]
MKKKLLVLYLTIVQTLFVFAAEENPLWMRYPSISPDGKEIAFSYKGNIYLVGSNGGNAIRLTTNTEFASQPIWSPDGEKIAFVAYRDNGLRDIALMSRNGAFDKFITTHSANETPYAFTTDGKSIVFGAHYQDPVESALVPGIFPELYKVSVEGGLPEMILAYAAQNINFDRSGQKFLYQDLKGFENTWRKHHTSSVTRDIWEYDLSTGKSRILISRDGEDTDPVYAPDGKGFYFLSEKSGSFNVFYSPLDRPMEMKQITSFKDHPVRFLSVAQNGTLCFGFDGEIYVMESGATAPRKLNISLIDNPINNISKKTFTSGITSASNSPDGKQVAFTVRGNVFVTSTEYSTTKQISKDIAVEDDVDFGSDNRSLVYSSYRDGYWNVYTAKIARKEDPNFPNATLIDEQELIPDDKSEKQCPKFSPDGKEVAFVKDRLKLMVYNLDTKQQREITDGSFQHDRNGRIVYEWSPDGKWFALEYVSNGHGPYTNIGIVSAEKGCEIYNITNSGYFNSSPRWVMDGNAILFESEMYGMRNHASWGSMGDVMIAFLNREAYNRYKMNKEEAEILADAEKAAKKKDEESSSKKSDKKSKEKDDKKDKEEKDTKKTIEIDFANIDKRIERLTPNSSKLGSAIINKDATKLYYLSAVEKDYDMWVYDLKERSTKLLTKLNSGYASFSLDKDSKTLFIFSNKKIQKMDMGSEKITPISYSAEMKIDLDAEREAMFNQVYKEEKERFYVTDMHGVDWDALTQHYRKFLPHINNNFDFAEMLSEMLGELNVSHTGSGYRPAVSGERTAELGILYTNTNEGIRIDEILLNSPFDNFQSKAKAGDIIEKIDGDSVALRDYFELLAGKTGKNTLISLYSPSTGNRWEEVIKPISSGVLQNMLMERWLRHRAEEVEKLSGGRLGYVHIASMSDASFRKMYADALGKYYQKEGIVIDIRYNGGGRLHEDIETFFTGTKYLQQVIRGKDYCEMPSRRWNKPSIMLMCEADYSNAHGTPWVYRTMKIGTLIGMPVPGTMTSVNWVKLQDPALHFGIPVVGYRTAEGIYLENFDLEPDIKAPLDLDRAIKGEDSQIEAAVKALLKEIDAKK